MSAVAVSGRPRTAPLAAGPVAADVAPGGVALSVRDLRKAYGPAGNHVLALESISLEVRRGEFVCLVGASGCGKTTLLNLLSGLDRQSRGEIRVDGVTTLREINKVTFVE